MAIITGTAGNDALNGTPDSDTIDGVGGDDVINGAGGDDELEGGADRDQINGGDGFDILHGQGGDDRLDDGTGPGEMHGGDGDDFLQVSSFFTAGVAKLADGGPGDDSFNISIADPTQVEVVGGTGADAVFFSNLWGTAEIGLGSDSDSDTITFFHPLFYENGAQSIYFDSITVSDFAGGAAGDLINWDNFLGTSLTGWDQSANPFSTGHLELVQSGADTLVRLDIDGGGDAYQTLLRLEDVAKNTLTAANFDGYDPGGAQAAGGTFEGGIGDDIIFGTIGDDVAHGHANHDQFIGDGGSDEFYGGDGNDTMFGQVGNDYFEGGADGDFAQAGPGADHLVGGAGDDVLSGEHGDDLIEGGDGDDRLIGGRGLDQLAGGAGNDLLEKNEGGGGTLDGGDDDDTILADAFTSAPLALLGGDGDDVISVAPATANIPETHVTADGGAGDDRIEIRSSNAPMQVYGGSGQDVVAIDGGPFNYFFGALFLKDFVAGLWGELFDFTSFLTDNLVGWNGTSNPFAAGYLRLVQSGGTTLLEVDADAAGAASFFFALARFENVATGDLSTENLGFSPIPVRTGTAKDDHIIGTAAGERIDGLASGDTLRGAGGADLLVGGGGDDLVDGGAGIDRHYGGTGHDIYEVDQTGDKVFEREQEGIDLVRSLAGFTLPDHVENLTLTGAGAIDGTGNALANAITGNGAVNLLIGGAGDDMLNGGGGADEMRGGADDDVYIVNAGADQVVELSGQGNDTVRSSAASYVLSANVETLVLTGGADLDGIGNALANILTGNTGNNRLDGGAGADAMAGGAGHDTYVVNNVADQVVEGGSSGNDSVESAVGFRLPTHVEKLILTGTLGYDGRGNSGANTITGNAGGNLLAGGGGNDVIDGGAGDDRLIGGAGQDELEGGAGDDRFYFNVAPGAADADGIVDFIDVDDAFYLLRSEFAGSGPNGMLAASAFHQGAAAADAGDRILYDAATGNLFYDSDGTGAAAALLFASVAPGTALTHADFVIYG